VRAYAASDEENLRTLSLLKDWAGEGFITEEQHLRMKQDAACSLRRTSIFLRAVLFLFTLISAGAAVALFFTVTSIRPDSPNGGVAFLVFAAICYAIAEFAVSTGRFYRHGVEEALVTLSVLFLCFTVDLVFTGQSRAAWIPPVGALAALLIYFRFGFLYAPAAAIMFAAWMPEHWTRSHAAQHLILAGIYAAGLTVIILLRRRRRFDLRDDEHSLIEALLWAAIYITVNLQIFSLGLLGHWWRSPADTSGYPDAFYWATYVMIWCLPAAMLWRGIDRKDRAVTALGLIAAILTLATNKPYLGLKHHAWDPMLRGVLLIGTAVWLKRWLAAGEDGVRRGFTARRLSASDAKFSSVLSTVGVVTAHAAVATAAPRHEPTFGGGDSGGGGATSDF
jgi:hypothetical protein